MFSFLFLPLLCLGASLARRSVTFPEDSPPANDTVQTRFGWTLMGSHLQALDPIFDGQGVQRENVVNAPTSYPPLPSSPSPLPDFEFSSSDNISSRPGTSFITGIVTPAVSYPSSAVSEQAASVVGLNRCDCMPAELCVNQTTRDGITTRIVTRPPTGVICSSGEIYCCIESSRFGCGLPNIIPGVTPNDGQADFGEFPWSAIILTNDDVYVGGGALIDSTHVVTAAHKVARYGNGAGLKIRLGDWDLSHENEPAAFLEVRISRIVNHPMYEATTLKNDISLITLATPVSTLTRPYPQINSICLPESTAIFTGSRCRVAGWGKDQFNGQYQHVIKKVEVPVLSSYDCQRKLRQTRLGSSFVLDTNSFLCAGGEASKDACTGDGGNALACLRDGHYYLAGITAGGIECGNENVPGLYVNLVNYLTWIYAQTSGGTSVGIDPRRRPS